MAGGRQRRQHSTGTAPEFQDGIADDLGQPEVEIDVLGKPGMFEVIQLRKLGVRVVQIGA